MVLTNIYKYLNERNWSKRGHPDQKYQFDYKVCLLGSEKVGKTYLAHKLTDLDYEEYRPAVECQKFIK